VLLEEIHRNVFADRDVDEPLGRVDGADDRRQVVSSSGSAKRFRRRAEVHVVHGVVAFWVVDKYLLLLFEAWLSVINYNF